MVHTCGIQSIAGAAHIPLVQHNLFIATIGKTCLTPNKVSLTTYKPAPNKLHTTKPVSKNVQITQVLDKGSRHYTYNTSLHKNDAEV